MNFATLKTFSCCSVTEVMLIITYVSYIVTKLLLFEHEEKVIAKSPFSDEVSSFLSCVGYTFVLTQSTESRYFSFSDEVYSRGFLKVSLRLNLSVAFI